MLLLLIVLQGSPVVAKVLDISLREEASLVRPYFCLGDIAAIHSDDSELATKLSALRIGRSPRVGSAEIVTRSALSARIQGALPAPVTAQWRGSARTRLHT